MIELALISLEKAINAYCRLDPDTITALLSLQGKVIRCEITDWNLQFYILPHDNGIQLSKQHEGTVDTTMKGTLNGLIRVGCAKGSSKAAKQHNVSISGDLDIAQTMQSILSTIDIDWEHHLAQCVGDTLAHQMGWFGRNIISAGKSIACSLKQSLAEFLHHESNTFPTQQQCHDFYHDVSQIKNDVERAEARVKRLQQTKNHDKTT